MQVPAYGGLYRITGKDADALGKSSEDAASPAAASGDLEAMVWEHSKTCYDPEIPVNIVDLGSVYAMEVAPIDGGAKRVDVKMTLTAQGAGWALDRYRCAPETSLAPRRSRRPS